MISVLQAFDEPLLLGGDGRSNSPGHSAKFGSYYWMDLEHNVVLDIELVQVCAAYLLWLEFIILFCRVMKWAQAMPWKKKGFLGG